MKKARQTSLFILLIFMLSACHASYYKVKITKPRNHFGGYYDASKDRGKKRVKTVKYKSLKKTRGIDDKK